jgi:hypothetical protein
MNSPEIRTVNVTRYVTPLREGGSLPAIAEADDGFLYVLKFRGAGQGVKALIADLIGGEVMPAVNKPDALLASKIVWLDCLLTNVDRTPRNTNMLIWRKELWLIDHGAALYFHHSWQNWQEQALRPFAQVKDHVLLSRATELPQVDKELRAVLTPERIAAIVSIVPDAWLTAEHPDLTAEEIRQVYQQFLTTRIASSEIFVKEAQYAREALV